MLLSILRDKTKFKKKKKKRKKKKTETVNGKLALRQGLNIDGKGVEVSNEVTEVRGKLQIKDL